MNDPIKDILKMKNPAEMFDLICAANYIRGNMDLNMPVEESREVYEKIVRLIRKKK